MKSNVNLILGDVVDNLNKIKGGGEKFNLVITSPPYAKQRNYNGCDSKDYVKWFLEVGFLIKDVLSNNGSFVLNIKEHANKGVKDLYVYKLVIALVEECGFHLIDEFIWNKTNPFPTGSKKRLKDGYERCFHFTKTLNYKFYPNNVLYKSTSKYIESEKRRKNNGAHNTTNGSGMNISNRICNEYVRPSNVLTMSTSNLNIAHPAAFPINLPLFFIKLLTDENDNVLDPFMGSGTSGLASKKLNRNFSGIELDENYFLLSKERINDE